jgi:hypothetical protein
VIQHWFVTMFGKDDGVTMYYMVLTLAFIALVGLAFRLMDWL